MSGVVKITRGGVEAEVVSRYVGDFLRDGWIKVEDAVEPEDEEKVELNKPKNHGK